MLHVQLQTITLCTACAPLPADAASQVADVVLSRSTFLLLEYLLFLSVHLHGYCHASEIIGVESAPSYSY